MLDPTRALVEKQVNRVRLRLSMHVAVESLLLGWAMGLLAITLWLLLRPLAFADASGLMRWAVPATLFGLSTLGGLVLAWSRRPDRVAAALALDERFGLKERVTTFLTLRADQLDTPAGQALVHDATAHLSTLKLAGAFPLRLAWQKWLMPVGALALAFVALALDPLLGKLTFASSDQIDENHRKIDAARVQDELDKIKKNVAQRNQEQITKSEELKKLEEELEKVLNKPLDAKNEDKIKERINELRNLEDKMKERLEGVKEKAEKIDALKRQLEKLGLDKERAIKDGPGKDFEEALRKGDLNKAKIALEKLAKDLKNNKLDDKQQKQLAEQFKKLNEELKKVMDEDQFMKKLKQDLKDGKITQKDLDREMENFKHVQDLTDVLGKAEDLLGSGSGKEAGDQLDKALNRFGEIELTEQEIRDLLRDQAEVADALDLLGEALEGDGMNGGGRPGGRRQADKDDPNTKPRDERSRAHADSKGAQRLTGYAKGGAFNKIPANSVDGAFRQAAQDGPEALNRQPIPDDYADIARKYFEKLGKQR